MPRGQSGQAAGRSKEEAAGRSRLRAISDLKFEIEEKGKIGASKHEGSKNLGPQGPALQRAAEEQCGRGHHDDGEDGEKQQVEGDGGESGVLEEQRLESVYGVGEGIDYGD